MPKVFSLYRPVVSGLDEVEHFIKQVSEDLELDHAAENSLQWGNQPRVAVFSAIGDLAEFMSRPPHANRIGSLLRASGQTIHASTRLWGKGLRSDRYEEDFPQVSLAHEIDRPGVDTTPAANEPLEIALHLALGQASQAGIRISPGVSKRADDTTTFRPFPLISAPGLSQDELNRYRRGIDFEALPIIELGPLSMGVSPAINTAYWENYGIIPSTR